MLNKKPFIYFKIAGYILFPAILLFLPGSFFDNGTSVCVSKVLLNMECYGCGMTRAIMHLIHFDFTGAWEYNKLSFIVFPLISFLWARHFWEDVQRADLLPRKA